MDRAMLESPVIKSHARQIDALETYSHENRLDINQVKNSNHYVATIMDRRMAHLEEQLDEIIKILKRNKITEKDKREKRYVLFERGEK